MAEDVFLTSRLIGAIVNRENKANMKNRLYDRSVLPATGIAVLVISLMTAFGQETGSTTAATDSSKAATTTNDGTATTPVLSTGVDDVLKLYRAKVGDSTINAFINNSGINYNLSANEIVYLREQGLSDRVITAMLEQPKNMNKGAIATTQNMSGSTNQSQVYALPATTVVQTVPSTVYVYRDYPVYDDWWYPSVSLDFVFGGGWYGGWYGGGFRDRDDHDHGGGSHWGGDGDHGSRGGGIWGGGGSSGGHIGGPRGGGSGMGGSRGGGGGGSRGGRR